MIETEKEYVLQRWPEATAYQADASEGIPYHLCVIVPSEYHVLVGETVVIRGIVIGGGNTEADAWHNAAVHLRMAEEFKESRQ